MKVRLVIQFFLEIQYYRLTMYRISKSAGLSSGAITRLMDETHKDISLSQAQKIAKGLGKINPYFEPVFWALIAAKEEEGEA